MSSTETLSEINDLLLRGKSALSVGDYKIALASFLEAFALNPANREVQTQLFSVLRYTDGYQLPPAFTEAIAKVAEHNEHDIQALASVIRNQYSYDEAIEELSLALMNLEPGGNLSEENEATLSSIFTDRLVRLVLTKAVCVSPELERLLTTLRHFHLNGWNAGLLDNSFAELDCEILALTASQTFNTQYVYSVSKHEQDTVADLTKGIHSKLPNVAPHVLALAACYTPLSVLFASTPQEHIEHLTKEAENWQHVMRQVWRQQVLEPQYEAKIRDNLQELTPIPEAASGTIREQYEAFPYPRWQTINMPQVTTLSEFTAANLTAASLPELPVGPIDVLIAGCGTGKQVIDIAKAFQTKNILAVDVSKTSLAYACRKTQEYSIDNTHFSLADITQISEWDAAFDLIVCTGVLHHLKDPSEGFKGLLGVSKPNSIFMLALYSARGREAATAARDFTSQNNIPSELPAIREMREAVRGLPYDHPIAPIQESQEFYSASGLVDYIFNKQETCYSPLELKQILDDHDLKFLGFHNLSSLHLQQYKEMFPDDISRLNLDHWEAYEIENPSVFTGMMQFWCCRKS